MGKIYDANGNKMDVAGICKEITEKVNADELKVMKECITKYDGILKKPNEILAHVFVDTYRKISSIDERGQRIRKLTAGIINKYQKSITEPRAEDIAEYQALLDYIKESTTE